MTRGHRLIEPAQADRGRLISDDFFGASCNESTGGRDYLGDVADHVELEEVFRVHQKEIYVYFLRTMGDAHLAEDLSQETFLRAFRSALLFRGDSSVRTWLFSIARKVLAGHLRRRRDVVSEILEAESVSTEVDPAEQLDIARAIERMPVPAREIVVLVDVLGFTPSEAAEALGLTSNAARVRLTRARGLFRKAYGVG